MSEKKEAKEEILRGLFEQSRSALCNLSPTGAQQTAKQLQKLVQAGRLSSDQAKRLENHLTVQMNRVSEVFERQVTFIAQQMGDRLQKVAQDELVEIESRLGKLESHPRLGPASKQL